MSVPKKSTALYNDSARAVIPRVKRMLAALCVKQSIAGHPERSYTRAAHEEASQRAFKSLLLCCSISRLTFSGLRTRFRR
eukprot:6211849-Pleurochrysis_carterae.AAC.8